MSHYKNHPATRPVNTEVEFIFRDGRRAKNVPELAEILSGCSNEDFIHHCNESKNDFAIWIRDAVGDTVLYESFKDPKNRDQAVEHLKNYLSKLESKPGLFHKLATRNETLRKILEKLMKRMREDADKLHSSGKIWLESRYTVKDIALGLVIGTVFGIILTISAVLT